MVKFLLLNELSLPFNSRNEIKKHFGNFFILLKTLKNKELQKLRTDKDFKKLEILPNIFFQKFIGQENDKEFRLKLKAFAANSTISLETPFIKSDETESECILENEYFYNDITNKGAFACSNIWNSLVISFNSKEEWNSAYIKIEKETIYDEKRKQIDVKHASNISHLASHEGYFLELEKFIRAGITPSNFWDKGSVLFTNKIILCKDIKKNINNIDTIIFSQALSILRDLDKCLKTLNDFTISTESKSVDNNPSLKKLRMFSISNEELYFNKHIKNLSNGYRIYYYEKNDKIHIGYIGKHLPTKKYS